VEIMVNHYKNLIGPNLTPGLILSLDFRYSPSFTIFYKELSSEKHERNYLFEDFLIWDSIVCPTKRYQIKGSDLIEKLNHNLKLPTEKEIKALNKLIKEKSLRTDLIRALMDAYDIEYIHNNFDLEELTSQR